MKGIYANIVWWVIILWGLIDAAINRQTSPQWKEMSNVALEYNLVYGSLGIFLVAGIVGLLKKKRWGYSLALSVNGTLAVLPLTIFVTSMVLLPDAPLSELLELQIINLIAGLISLGFFVWLLRSKKSLGYAKNGM